MYSYESLPQKIKNNLHKFHLQKIFSRFNHNYLLILEVKIVNIHEKWKF